MNWEELNEMGQLDKIDEESQSGKAVIFKHSTRCSISDAAWSRFKRDWKDNEHVKLYYLDLIKHRAISDAIAKRYQIKHESPQVLLISDRKCIYSETHLSIEIAEILSYIKSET